MTKETIKTFQYRITQATASQLVVILYDMAIEYLNDASVVLAFSDAEKSCSI